MPNRQGQEDLGEESRTYPIAPWNRASETKAATGTESLSVNHQEYRRPAQPAARGGHSGRPGRLSVPAIHSRSRSIWSLSPLSRKPGGRGQRFEQRARAELKQKTHSPHDGALFRHCRLIPPSASSSELKLRSQARLAAAAALPDSGRTVAAAMEVQTAHRSCAEETGRIVAGQAICGRPGERR